MLSKTKILTTFLMKALNSKISTCPRNIHIFNTTFKVSTNLKNKFEMLTLDIAYL